MRRMRDLIMLPIIDPNTGERLGWVKDIVFESATNTVTGIIMEKDTFLKPQQLKIARADIASFGKESLTIAQLTPQEVVGTCWSQKVGSKVYNDNGDIKGTIGDIYVDNLVQNIVGYEISDGLFADLYKGRNAVFQNNILAESQDVVIIEGGVLS
ncbi:MAG: hypothetical protein GX207_05325 [Peptococcaceae bacterium]|nr:hypothetical protein [Peptococcaceae bacterium]